MKKTTPITKILTTNCTIVDASAGLPAILQLFERFPNRFFPVVDGLRFVGVIYRDEFLEKFITCQESTISAKDLISKQMVKLDTSNTIEDAKEIFDTGVFDMLPVTDEEGDLQGILLQEDVQAVYENVFTENWKAYSTLQRIMSLFTFL